MLLSANSGTSGNKSSSRCTAKLTYQFTEAIVHWGHSSLAAVAISCRCQPDVGGADRPPYVVRYNQPRCADSARDCKLLTLSNTGKPESHLLRPPASATLPHKRMGSMNL